MKTQLFQSCGHCWGFQIRWHTECSSFTASSFRMWNSSSGIPSSPLALFLVMLPKAHLTSHSRMSGSRLVITPLWLSGSWRSFLYSSFVYSCYLFLLSSASVRSLPFLSFIMPIFAWNVPFVSLGQGSSTKFLACNFLFCFFVWFWYKCNGGFIQWLWECLLPFNHLEEFEKDWYKYFVYQFPSEAIGLVCRSVVLFFQLKDIVWCLEMSLFRFSRRLDSVLVGCMILGTGLF